MGEFAAKTLKAKTAAIIDDRTAYGQGVAEQFERVAKANGIKIVDQQFTNSQVTDFLGILTAIKSKNPDVIFFGGYASQGAPMAKQMRQRGIRAKLLGGDGICSADMGKVAGEAASIVYCAQGGVALDKTAEGREFLKKYHDAYHTDTQVYGVNYYYDGVKMLADAMKKAGTTTDKAKLIAQLAKEKYKGVAGTYSFDCERRSAKRADERLCDPQRPARALRAITMKLTRSISTVEVHTGGEPFASSRTACRACPATPSSSAAHGSRKTPMTSAAR